MGNISRRGLMRAGGALVVSFAGPVAVPLGASAQGLPEAGPPPGQLDSWLAIQNDGGVIVFFGKMDPGQGVDVAIRQIVAEELDVAVERIAIVMGDSARTVNQGGASGSTGVERGGITLRYAGAEARRVLLDLAAQHLGVAVAALQVRDGVVSVVANPTRQASYAALIGDRHFDVPMQWNGVYGNGLVARGRAEPKRPGDYRIVGTSVPRTDITEKIFARHQFVT
ncbi:MAG TPA: molybdopterin cofactor-binding domain-containing protein, partial [Acetobacteraceae bacterium]|nr:molybdopterin cofactor-binding domain-containing protein [Acetobacteraceae bacterium]